MSEKTTQAKTEPKAEPKKVDGFSLPENGFYQGFNQYGEPLEEAKPDPEPAPKQESVPNQQPDPNASQQPSATVPPQQVQPATGQPNQTVATLQQQVQMLTNQIGMLMKSQQMPQQGQIQGFQPQPQMQQQMAPPPQPAINFQTTDEDYNSAMESREGFEKVMQKQFSTAYETIMQKVPQMVTEIAQGQMQNHAVVSSFYMSHPHLANHKDVVTGLAQQIAAQNPHMSLPQVLGQVVTRMNTLVPNQQVQPQQPQQQQVQIRPAMQQGQPPVYTQHYAPPPNQMPVAPAMPSPNGVRTAAPVIPQLSEMHKEMEEMKGFGKERITYR